MSVFVLIIVGVGQLEKKTGARCVYSEISWFFRVESEIKIW